MLKPVPDWANFVATDQNNLVYAYQYEPVMRTHHWMGARLCYLGQAHPWPCSDNSWKNSKIQVREDVDPKYLRAE